MDECVFCKIIKGDIKVDFVYEDSDCVVFNSNAPVAEHHLLVVPKKHFTNFMELDEIILAMTKNAQKIIIDKNLLDGYKMVFNGGKFQEVMHVHWHILAGKFKNEDDILNKI
jgi:histidine triad (HIT) family protein